MALTTSGEEEGSEPKAEMSPPATKARPVAAMTMARTPLRPATSSIAAASACAMLTSTAFSTSGRLSTMRAMPVSVSCSTMTTSLTLSLPVQAAE